MSNWIDDGPRCPRLTRTGRHKVCYRSELAALMVAAKIEARVGVRYPYLCPVCQCWHLTKRQQVERNAQIVVDAIMRAIGELHTAEFQEAWKALPAELRNDKIIEATAVLDYTRRGLQRHIAGLPVYG